MRRLGFNMPFRPDHTSTPLQVKLEHRGFKTPSGKSIELTTVASNYHIEINPGDAGIYDRFVVQDLIKEMAAYSPLDTAHSFKGAFGHKEGREERGKVRLLRRSFDTSPHPQLVLSTPHFPSFPFPFSIFPRSRAPLRGGPPHEGGAGKLASHDGEVLRDLQVRRYSLASRRGNEAWLLAPLDPLSPIDFPPNPTPVFRRLILVCSSPSKVIEPLRSRCLGVRVPAPAQSDMITVLTATATKEGLTLPTSFAAKIAAQSGRNMRRALLLLEAAKVQQYPFTQAQPVSR
jgi:hypothetical protein